MDRGVDSGLGVGRDDTETDDRVPRPLEEEFSVFLPRRGLRDSRVTDELWEYIVQSMAPRLIAGSHVFVSGPEEIPDRPEGTAYVPAIHLGVNPRPGSTWVGYFVRP